jgi:poly-gamma-glutamate system protein
MKTRSVLIYAAALLSLLAWGAERFLVPAAGAELRTVMVRAAGIMESSLAALRDCGERRGLTVDAHADLNGTGIIGVEQSPITTTLGNLEAKRTTANPAWAALLAGLLDEAGVRRGDPVAVGASSSFPGLIVATLSAAESLGARPLLIVSLGASQWGANRPEFGWLDMEDCLRTAGLLNERAIAVSPGGDGDAGRDLSEEGRALLLARVAGAGIPRIEESDLARNVEARMAAYGRAAGGRPIKAFVNIGGSWANIGTETSVLELRPGLTRTRLRYRPGRNGVLQAMSARGVPVLHLLNVRGLCRRYGLPWDPVPLPRPSARAVGFRELPERPAFIALAAGYLFLLALALFGLGRLPAAR